jgi:hypothetical protein
MVMHNLQQNNFKMTSLTKNVKLIGCAKWLFLNCVILIGEGFICFGVKLGQKGWSIKVLTGEGGRVSKIYQNAL